MESQRVLVMAPSGYSFTSVREDIRLILCKQKSTHTANIVAPKSSVKLF